MSNTFNINVVNVNGLHTSGLDANVSYIELNKTESLADAAKPISKNKHISGVTSTSHLSLELPGASPPSTNWDFGYLDHLSEDNFNIEFAENQNTEPEEKIRPEKYQEEKIVSILA